MGKLQNKTENRKAAKKVAPKYGCLTERAQVLRDCVLSAIPYSAWGHGISARAIHQRVLDDYGSVTMRTVYRALADLVTWGVVSPDRSEPDSCDWFYTRPIIRRHTAHSVVRKAVAT